MRNLVGRFRDRFRLDEKVVWFIRHQFASPLEIDHYINDEVGHMRALWSDFPGHGFGEDSPGTSS